MSNIVIPDGGNIGSASDPDAISIASDGGLTFSGGIDNAGNISAGTIRGGVKVVNAIDTFKITLATITSSGNAISSTAFSNTFYTPVSGVVTVSSDVFTFSQTGVYIFNYVFNFSDNEDERAVSFQLRHTTDGSTPTVTSPSILLNQINNSDVGGSNPTKFFMSGSTVLNINSTNIKFIPEGATSSASMSIISGDTLVSYFQFVKIGESI